MMSTCANEGEECLCDGRVVFGARDKIENESNKHKKGDWGLNGD